VTLEFIEPYIGQDPTTTAAMLVDGDGACRIDGEEVGPCTAGDPSTACSGPGNCCGF
jgi:hypothetical protein